MGGGAGGDWGQRMGSEYFVNSLNSNDVTILLHEIGHRLHGLRVCTGRPGVRTSAVK